MSSNLTKFHAAADRVFNLTANDLFDRDDFLRGAPEGAYRVTRSIIVLVMRTGEGAWPQSVRQARFSMAKLIQSVRLTQIARMGHDQRLRHRLHPTSRRCSTSCRRHARLRNTGARRALFRPSFDPTALRPLPREASGLLRGRRGICLCRFIWEDCKGECCYAFTRKATATDTQEG